MNRRLFNFPGRRVQGISGNTKRREGQISRQKLVLCLVGWAELRPIQQMQTRWTKLIPNENLRQFLTNFYILSNFTKITSTVQQDCFVCLLFEIDPDSTNGTNCILQITQFFVVIPLYCPLTPFLNLKYFTTLHNDPEAPKDQQARQRI